VRFSDDPHVTFFTSAAATKLRSERMSLPALRDLIRGTSASIKSKLPWLKLAVFGQERTSKGSLRHDANVMGISGCEADYDGEELAFDDAVDILHQAQILSLIYTSPSHTVDKPRWRVLTPSSLMLPTHARGKLVARLNGLFGGIFAEESFVLSQAYYYGSINNNRDHRAFIIDGEYIDKRRGAPLQSKMVLDMVPGTSLLRVFTHPRYHNRWREEPYYSDLKALSRAGLTGTAFYRTLAFDDRKRGHIILPHKDVSYPLDVLHPEGPVSIGREIFYQQQMDLSLEEEFESCLHGEVMAAQRYSEYDEALYHAQVALTND
jgi:hypothetical protein